MASLEWVFGDCFRYRLCDRLDDLHGVGKLISLMLVTCCEHLPLLCRPVSVSLQFPYIWSQRQKGILLICIGALCCLSAVVECYVNDRLCLSAGRYRLAVLRLFKGQHAVGSTIRYLEMGELDLRIDCDG